MTRVPDLYPYRSDDMATTQRVAAVVEALVLGRRLTTGDVAKMVGITRQGAHYLLSGISAMVSIRQDDCGNWYYLPRVS